MSNTLHNTSTLKQTEGKLNYELDFNFLKQLAERMQANKDKYQPYGWKQPQDIEQLKQALFRHTLEVMNGNYSDDGRDMGHLEAIALNVMFINYQLKQEQSLLVLHMQEEISKQTYERELEDQEIFY